MPTVTMQQIAEAAKVTRATVSLALRAHPSISLPTRDRIVKLAEEMGYRPNPMISALMSNLRSGRPQSGATVLAYLSPFTAGQTRSKPSAQRYFDGARDRADELGYRLEFFCFGREGLSENRLATILTTRAIRGLLISPGDIRDGDYSLDLPWDQFCVATLGYTLTKPLLNRAVNHQFHTISQALTTATRYGYGRVGLLIHRDDDARTEGLWQAGYLLYQQGIPKPDRLPVGFLDDLDSPQKLGHWLGRHRPEAVLILHPEIHQQVVKAGAMVPMKTGVILLDRSPVHVGLAGMDQRPELVGHMGINLVVRRLGHNEHGLPAIQSIILTEGEWVDDTSLPDLRSTTPPSISAQKPQKRTTQPKKNPKL